MKAHGGWAFGANHPSVIVSFENASGSAGIRAVWRELRDLGPLPGLSGGLNTFSALAGGNDWLDPWVSSGLSVFLGRAAGNVSSRISLTWERHGPAHRVSDPHDERRFRPLPSVVEGSLSAIEFERSIALSDALALDVTGQVGWFDPDGDAEARAVGRTRGVLEWERASSGANFHMGARADVGFAFGDMPPQQLYYLGGRGTLPGHPFRGQSGNSYWLARAEVAYSVFDPWVALRVFAAAGAVTGSHLLASAGPGLGLGWNVVHVDLGRGLDGGQWEWVVSVDHRFRRWL